MKRLLIVSACLLTASLAGSQINPPLPMTCDPLPPASVVHGGDQLTAWDGIDFTLYSGRNKTTVTIRQVTGGVVVNWIGDPSSWALAPRIDAFYAWESGYGAYCRHFSTGVDKTAQIGCRTDCLTRWDGGWYYSVMRFNGDWRVVVVEKLGAEVE